MRRETALNLKQKLQQSVTISSYDKTLLQSTVDFVINLFIPSKRKVHVNKAEIRSSKNKIIMYKATITTENPNTLLKK